MNVVDVLWFIQRLLTLLFRFIRACFRLDSIKNAFDVRRRAIPAKCVVDSELRFKAPTEALLVSDFVKMFVDGYRVLLDLFQVVLL